MNIFNKILVFFLAVIILICYHGFFFVQYVCCACSSLHEEVVFLQIDENSEENSNNSYDENTCFDNNCKHCLHKQQQHHHHHKNKNTKVEYFSLKNLFTTSYKISIKPAILKTFINNFIINCDYFYLNLYNMGNNLNIIFHSHKFKIPNFKTQFVGNINHFAAISVFRI